MIEDARMEALRRLQRTEPSDADALFRAALKAVQSALETEALPYLEAGVERHPTDPRIWQVLGLAHRKREDMAQSLNAFSKAFALAPGDPLLAHSVARATLEAGLPAVPAFELASRLAPNDGGVVLGHAAALFAEKRASEAILLLDAQLRRNPAWLEGHATVARLRWMHGDRVDFTKTFREALRVFPRTLELWHALIDILMEAKLYDQALSTVREARSIAGESVLFDALEGVCNAELGATADGDRIFERLGPNPHMSLVVRHVRHLIRSGRPGEAARLSESRVYDEGGHVLWPYIALAWRITGDARWQWLEGDPRFIGVYDIGEKVGSLDALAACLRRLHLATHQPMEQSLRGGTQTDGALFARIEPEIRELRRAIVETVEQYVATLPLFDPEHPLLIRNRAPTRFAGSWSVRLTDKGFHANHVHPVGWISSAFYVSLPESAMGGPAQAGWLTLGEATELGVDLDPIRVVEPKPGRLVLFPSTMWHGTRPFDAGERLTVAFDIARPPQ